MKIFGTGLAALTLGAAMLVPLSSAQAETIRDVVMGFAIDFPGDADREELDDDMPEWVHEAVSWDQYDDRGYYNVMAVRTLPHEQVFTDPAAVLRDLRGECVVGDEVLNEQRITLAGVPGMEVLTRRRESTGVIYDLVRYTARKNKIYCVRGTYRDGDDGSRARAFVRSFRID